MKYWQLFVVIVIAMILYFAMTIDSHGADYQKVMFAEFNHSDDSDYAKLNETSVGHKLMYSHKQYVGASVGYAKYREDNGDDEYMFLNIMGRKNFTDKYYLECDLRFYNSNDYSPVTYNLSGVAQDEKYGRIELFTERSLIDSHAALQEKLHFTTYGVSGDYYLNDEYTITGVLFHQHANDGNNRLVEVAQLTYSPKWFENAYIKGRGKWRQADFNPPEYFTPEKFSRYDLLVGYSYVFWKENFVIKGEIGPGYQYIDDVGETGYEYRVEIKGWITPDLQVKTFYATTTDAGEDDYRYTWAGISLNYYY